jgi:CHAD domain-containing protein
MKLDEGACAFGAGVLLRHLEALEKAGAGVHQGEQDIEYVHEARVASRRLRATIPLFKACLPPRKTKRWLGSIRKITRALGEARDTDVQLEWLQKYQEKLPEKRYLPGISRLVLRLRQKRERLQGSLTAAMGKVLDSNLLAEMSAVLQPAAGRAEEIYIYTPVLYQHSYQSITGHLDTFLSYDTIVDQPEKVAELHQMRIAAKWLRYTMETFAPLYADQLKDCMKVVRASQELLGEIHDGDVWQTFLPGFLDEERQRIHDYFGHELPFKRLVAGIQYLEQDRRQERDTLYGQFVENWHSWQAAGVWSGLHSTLQVPFLQPGQIYPPLQLQ